MQFITDCARKYGMHETLSALDQKPEEKDRILSALMREITKAPAEVQLEITEKVIAGLL